MRGRGSKPLAPRAAGFPRPPPGPACSMEVSRLSDNQAGISRPGGSAITPHGAGDQVSLSPTSGGIFADADQHLAEVLAAQELQECLGSRRQTVDDVLAEL